MFFAFIIIAVGTVLLLNTLGIINVSSWGIFWAILLILIGIKMLFGKGRFKGFHCCSEKDEKK